MARLRRSWTWSCLLGAAVALGVAGCGGGGGGGGGGAAPATGVGSRFWYVGDTFGNPLKTHSGAEASFAQQVATLVNQERAAQSLPPLAVDAEAERAAKAHAEDMQGRAYFSHTTPEGWSPSTRLSLLGASGFSGVGENIAVGQPTPAAVMADWMASSGHRANILNASFTHLGVGVDETSGPYWVQVFLRRP